jgi:uncharacterized protein (DUF58 family)
MTAGPDRLPEKEIRRLADQYRIVLDAISSAGTFGAKAGRETGASVEIQDFRNYVPGDDPRRIDWFSYARTGNLIVRLYREEVSPFFDIIVDSSASMAIRDGRKGPLAHELCDWLFHSAHSAGLAVRLFAAGSRMQRLEEPGQLAFREEESILFSTPRQACGGLRRSSVRLVLSDFMSPYSATAAVTALAAGCSRLIAMHLLGPFEASPDPRGPAVLDAVEEGRKADITLDRRAVETYARRLQALKDEVREQVFKCAGLHLEIVADRDLERVLRETMLPLGLVEVV